MSAKFKSSGCGDLFLMTGAQPLSSFKVHAGAHLTLWRWFAKGEHTYLAADDHTAACRVPLLIKGMRRAHLKTVLSGVVRRREVATVVQQHRNISATLFQLLCELVHRPVGIDSTSDTQYRLTWL